MRQHYYTVRPIFIILVVLSTGAAMVVVFDWINNDDTISDDNLFNQDLSLGNGDVEQSEAFEPITTDNGALSPIILDSAEGRSGLAMAWETALGSPDAGVTIIEYGTYGCQICRQVHQNGMVEKLLVDYPDDIRFIYVNWPIYHPNDELATEAVFCAQDQGNDKFWLYHNALFELSLSDYNDLDQPSDHVSLAEQSDIDADALAICLAGGKFREYVYELAIRGYELALPGTPTFIVNGTPTRAFGLEAAVLALINEQHTSDELIEE